MNSIFEKNRGASLRAAFMIAVPVALLIIAALVWLTFGQRDALQLMPVLPDPTTIAFLSDESQATVSFSELNDNPIAYLNKTIIVSGSYLPVEKVDCLRYSGPSVRWSLTAENLQLDALGYERVVRLLPVGTAMTVRGIWRLYQGPLGCGKGPPNGSAWYLDVRKILQPNPLVGTSGQAVPFNIENGDPGLPDLLPTLAVDVVVPTTTTNDFITVTVEGTEIIPPTTEGQVTITATPTSPGAVPPTVTAQTTFTPLAPTGTAVVGPTATAAPTNDPTIPTATLTPELPPVPATATENPGGGYPGPVETLTPTPTLDPYP